MFTDWQDLFAEMHQLIAECLDIGSRQCLAMTCRAHKARWYNTSILFLSTLDKHAIGPFFQEAHPLYIQWYLYKNWSCNPRVHFGHTMHDRLKKELKHICKTRSFDDLLDLAIYCFDRQRIQWARQSRFMQWWNGDTRDKMPEIHACHQVPLKHMAQLLAENGRPVEYKQWCHHWKYTWDIQDHYKAAKKGHVSFLMAFPQSFYNPRNISYNENQQRTLVYRLLQSNEDVDWPLFFGSKIWMSIWQRAWKNPSANCLENYLDAIRLHMEHLPHIWAYLPDTIQQTLLAEKEGLLQHVAKYYQNIEDIMVFLLDTLHADMGDRTDFTKNIIAASPEKEKEDDIKDLTWAWTRGFLSLDDVDFIDIATLVPKLITPTMRQWFEEHPFPNSDVLVEEMDVCLLAMQ
jgi:hypothetical protein